MILTLTLNPALDLWTTTPRLTPSSKMRCAQVLRHPGGGGVNVARVLHRLGADCVALCALGGPEGALVLQLLQAEGVATALVEIAGSTRENLTVATQEDAQEYRFVLPGPVLSDSEWQACLQQVQVQAQGHGRPDFVVASGSLPPGVPDDFLARLATMTLAAGSKLVVDSSGAALAAALAHGVYMVKPSLREMRELSQLPLASVREVQQAALQWVRRGQAELVVVSMGDAGAVLASARGCFQARPLAVNAISAVGAGDSFVAGMTWALAQGLPPAAALRHGVACGSAAVMHPGTALCERAEVDALLAQVECVALD